MRGKFPYLIIGAFIVATGVANCAAPNNPLTNEYQVMPTVFAEDAPKVSLISASGTRDTLEFTLSVSGLSVMADEFDLANWLCDPRVTTEGAARVSGFGYDVTKLNGLSAPINWVAGGNPFEIHYHGEWVLANPEVRNVPMHIDLTFGPCYPSFQEGTTPVPEINLIANYTMDLSVPIQ